MKPPADLDRAQEVMSRIQPICFGRANLFDIEERYEFYTRDRVRVLDKDWPGLLRNETSDFVTLIMRPITQALIPTADRSLVPLFTTRDQRFSLSENPPPPLAGNNMRTAARRRVQRRREGSLAQSSTRHPTWIYLPSGEAVPSQDVAPTTPQPIESAAMRMPPPSPIRFLDCCQRAYSFPFTLCRSSVVRWPALIPL